MAFKSRPICIREGIAYRCLWFLPQLPAFLVFGWDKESRFLIRHLPIDFLHARPDPLLQKVF
jgi:hypothetical protein